MSTSVGELAANRLHLLLTTGCTHYSQICGWASAVDPHCKQQSKGSPRLCFRIFSTASFVLSPEDRLAAVGGGCWQEWSVSSISFSVDSRFDQSTCKGNATCVPLPPPPPPCPQQYNAATTAFRCSSFHVSYLASRHPPRCVCAPSPPRDLSINSWSVKAAWRTSRAFLPGDRSSTPP